PSCATETPEISRIHGVLPSKPSALVSGYADSSSTYMPVARSLVYVAVPLSPLSSVAYSTWSVPSRGKSPIASWFARRTASTVFATGCADALEMLDKKIAVKRVVLIIRPVYYRRSWSSYIVSTERQMQHDGVELERLVRDVRWLKTYAVLITVATLLLV